MLPGAVDGGQNGGAKALMDFLTSISCNEQKADAVSVFHGVRQLPYRSTGDRSIEGILARRAGSCSSKHILLVALLDKIGVKADVELVLGDFATPLREAHNVPEPFMIVAKEGIRDIHNIVRANINGHSVVMDATWHDHVKPFGFRVNDTWSGTGDTRIAVDVENMLGPSDDPAAEKAKIIASWPREEQTRRRRFLEMINKWVAGLSAQRPISRT